MKDTTAVPTEIWRPSIFLSYSGVDRVHVVPLQEVLDKRQVRHFDYMRTPLHTDDLCKELRELVALHDAIISILGKSCFDSEYFREEINTAGQCDMPQCIIQFARYHEKPLLLLTQQFDFIDATSDAARAVSGLEAWLDKMMW